MNIIENLFTPEISHFLNNLENKHVSYSHVINHPIEDLKTSNTHQFYIKKVKFGRLDLGEPFAQIMFVNTFNAVFIISSVESILLENNRITFYIDDSKTIFHFIELINQEGEHS